MSTVTNLDDSTNAAVQEFLRRRLNQYGFERADVHAGEDHSGDPALFIDAYYRLTNEPLERELLVHLLTELRGLLLNRGERRFPHMRHHFDEKQQVAKRK
jgi:hypothetical protein